MKITIKETCEVCRTYEIEADSIEDAENKMYSGKYEPTQWDEKNNELTFFDDKGNVIEE